MNINMYSFLTDEVKRQKVIYSSILIFHFPNLVKYHSPNIFTELFLSIYITKPFDVNFYF